MKKPLWLLKQRYERLGFFLLDERAAGLKDHILTKHCCAHLLDGMTGSSWRSVVYIIGRWIEDNRLSFQSWRFFFWHRTILRKSKDEINQLIDQM